MSASVSSSVFTLVSSAFGGGLLTLPFAVMQTGWLVGLLLLLVSGGLNFISISMLIDCTHKVKKYSYASLLGQAIGAKSALVLDLVMVMYGFGAIIAYYIYLADFLTPLTSVVSSGYLECNRSCSILVSFCVALPLTFPEKLSALKFVSPISTLSLLFTAIVVVFRSPGNHANSDKIFEAVKLDPNFLQSFSIILFSFVCHLNVVSVAAELAEPTPARIRRVACLVSGLLFVFYSLIGVLGYFSFGSGISQNFINNFPADNLATTVRLTLTLTLLFSLPITASPTSHAIVHYALALGLVSPPGGRLRLGAAAAVLGSAAVIANYLTGAAVVLGVLGGSFGTLLMLVFPALIYRTIFRDEMTAQGIFGVSLMAAGSAVSFASVAFTLLNAIGIN